MTVVVVVVLFAVVVTWLVLRRAERWADDAVTEELDLARNVRELRAMSDTPLRASDEHYMALAWRDHPWAQQ